MQIKDIPLVKGEFYDVKTKKDTIYLHHTAGSHRPDWSINGWNKDKTKSGQQLRVATAYVMGGKSTTDGNEDWDGVICRCFDDSKWAHHLGLNTVNNVTLNQKSIGIEICNYGPITLGRDGLYYNYVKRPVPKDHVVELKKPFQGKTLYHRYTDKQIAALKELILDIANRHSIDVRAGLRPLLDKGQTNDAFSYNASAVKGTPGIWTHTNVRKDKFDCSPQEHLIEMLRSL